MNKFTKFLKMILITPEIYILLFGFLINFWYEVSQVPFFLGVNRGQSYFEPNTYETRLFFVQTFNRAAFLDSIIVLGCHVINSLIYGSRLWFVRGGTLFGREKVKLKPWTGYVISAIIASGFLVLTEYNAAVNDLWGYDPSMPMIWDLGLVPIIAMLFTPNLSFLLANRVYSANIHTRIEINHGMNIENLDSSKSEEYVKYMLDYMYSRKKTTRSEWVGIIVVSVFLIAVLVWYFGFFS